MLDLSQIYIRKSCDRTTSHSLGRNILPDMFMFLVYNVWLMRPTSGLSAQVPCSHVTPRFSLHISLPIVTPPPPPPLWLHCLQLSALSKSAGLNVVRETLLKAQGSISLVQMHRVSLKFHANRHILFKQLWGYPQAEACLLLLVLLTFLSLEPTKAMMYRAALSDWYKIPTEKHS